MHYYKKTCSKNLIFDQIMEDKKGKSWKYFQHHDICDNFCFLHILKFDQETSFKTGYFSFGFCSICVHILYSFYFCGLNHRAISPKNILRTHIFFPLIYNISMHKHLYKTASKKMSGVEEINISCEAGMEESFPVQTCVNF